jgi:hypothetical protein
VTSILLPDPTAVAAAGPAASPVAPSPGDTLRLHDDPVGPDTFGEIR